MMVLLIMQNNTTIKPLNQNKMTPKEKAEELFVRFNKEGLHQISSVINRFIRKQMIKQCALVAVDEIINIIDAEDQFILYNYWLQVKTEIEQL